MAWMQHLRFFELPSVSVGVDDVAIGGGFTALIERIGARVEAISVWPELQVVGGGAPAVIDPAVLPHILAHDVIASFVCTAAETGPAAITLLSATPAPLFTKLTCRTATLTLGAATATLPRLRS